MLSGLRINIVVVMRNLKKGRKLHREKGQRKALLRSLGGSLVLKGGITTTEAKAKELRRFIEKKITKAMKGDIATRRYLERFFPKEVVKKLVDETAPSYKERKGGYTRIIKIGRRKNDGAEIVKIELI